MDGIGKIDGSAVQALIAATRSMASAGVTGVGAAVAAPAGADGASGFGSALRQALERVNADQTRADGLQQQYQLGNPAVSLEEAMLATQTANISFQGIVQVRNRMVSAYHDIMNMQV